MTESDARYDAARPTRRAGDWSLAELRQAIEDAIMGVLGGEFPDLSEEERRQMVRESPVLTRPMTKQELLESGRAITADEARPTRGSGRGSDPGPWVAVALILAAGEGREWEVPVDSAEAAQRAIGNKRRRDGKHDDGTWVTPIWANYRTVREGIATLKVVNDPERT